MTNWFPIRLETHPWPPDIGDDLRVLDTTAFSKITEITSNEIQRVVSRTDDFAVPKVLDATPGRGNIVEVTSNAPPKVTDLSPLGAYRVVDVTPPAGKVVEILSDPLLVEQVVP